MQATPLEIAIGQTAASAIGNTFTTLWHKHIDKRTLQRVASMSPDQRQIPRLPSVTPAQAAQIASYIQSTDFQVVATEYVLLILQEAAGQRPAVSSHALSTHILTALHKRLPDLPREEIKELSEIFGTTLSNNIIRTIAIAFPNVKHLPTDITSRLVTAITDQAAAGARASQVLAGIVDLASIDTFENQLRDQIRALRSRMYLPNAGPIKTTSFESLYVTPTFTFVDTIDKSAPQAGASTPDDVLRHPRLVILGNPGGGKSTLAAKTVYDLVASQSPGIGRTPFLIALRDLARDFKGASHTLTHYLANQCRSPYQLEPPKGAIEYMLLNGHALVIFDGLDELTETYIRRDVVDSIEAFAHMYPATRIVVTSRRVGYYETAFDTNLFATSELSDFSPKQVRQYAQNWFSLSNPASAADMVSTFMSESQVAEDLRVNPLMLSLICGLYSVEGYIPPNRPDVYEKCALLLFERWDRQRGIPTSLPFDAHVRSAIQSLAWWLYTNGEGEQGIPQSKLSAYMTEYLHRERFAVREDAENASKSFIEFCTGRAWVLTNIDSTVDEEIYGFTHRTFLEYFAATQLARQCPDPRMLFDQLEPHLVATEWDMVAQLALQVANRHVEGAANEFITYLLASAAVSSIESRSKLLSFAARSLAFVVPSPRILSSLVSEILVFSLDMPSHGGNPQPRDTVNLGNLHLYDAPLQELAKCRGEIIRELAPVMFRGMSAGIAERSQDPDGAHSNWLLACAAAGLYGLSELSVFAASEWESLINESLRHSCMWRDISYCLGGRDTVASLVDRYGPAALYYGPIISPSRGTFWLLHGIYAQTLGWTGGSSGRRRMIGELLSVLSELDCPWFGNEDLRLLRLSACAVKLSVDAIEDGAAMAAVILLSLPIVESGSTEEEEFRRAGLHSSTTADFVGQIGLVRACIEVREGRDKDRNLSLLLAEAGVPAQVRKMVLEWARNRLTFLA